MAADEAGRRRYNHNDPKWDKEVDIKSFTRKRGLLEGSKNGILSPKGSFKDRE